MKKLLLILPLLICVHAFAQKDPLPKYSSMIKAENLKKHLTIIASDSMQGRETGTEGQRKAAAYIEEQFKSIGLKTAKGMNGYQQFYPLYKDSMLSSHLIINGSELVYGTDYTGNVNINENAAIKASQVVFAGYGIEDSAYNDYSSLDVKGKIVLMFIGEPRSEGKFLVSGTTKSSVWTFPGQSTKLELAAKKGAVAVLFINPASESFSQRSIEISKKTPLFYPRDSKEEYVNFATLGHAYLKKWLGTDGDSLIRIAKRSEVFARENRFEKNIDISFSWEKIRSTVEASNVIGIIEGTDKKDEYVFLTGHYDHLGMRDGKIYYGADDDGSGTVAVIQMAEAFVKAKAAGKGPRRTIVFMTVSGEEKGLWGSEYYSDHPIYPIDKTSVDLNTDMVGRVDTERGTADTLNYVYVVGHDKLSSDLPVINESINKKYTNLVLDYKFDDPNDPNKIYFRSDHYNFARKGIPVLFFYDGMLKADYHRPTDTVDKINWPLYETRVRMIFNTAWEIANRNDMLKRDIPLPESATRGR